MEKLTKEQIQDLIENWTSSKEYRKISLYKKYYEGENPPLEDKVKDRSKRGKNPNNFVPTAYYTTVVDSMAGYMFNNVTYSSEGDYNEMINAIMTDNNADIIDMRSGILGLAYNKSCELVYSESDDTGAAVTKFTSLQPLSVIPVYTDDIVPELYCGIWYREKDKDSSYVDVIYADEWQQYIAKDSVISERRDIPVKDSEEQAFSRTLYFDECPIIIYNTQVIGHKSPFHQILPYINALDWLITGNSNEIDRLVDALLVVGTHIAAEDLEHMDEWKALQGIKNEDRAEYLTKDMSPGFREYVSSLLVQEIHKHAHVVDWYNPDTGLSGAASGKALQTRMFDMDMYSRRIEKIYKEGTEKRVRLIGKLEEIKVAGSVEPVKITFKRDSINDFETKIAALNQATYLSAQTKVEESGFNWEEEKVRLEEEALTRVAGYGEITDEELAGTDLDVIEESAADAIVLNGAQITAARGIAVDVANGELTRESGIELVMALGIPREQAEKIVPAQGTKITA